MADEQPQVQFDIRVAPELEGGVYANFTSIWHTAHEFTLDFAATLPPEPGTDDAGQPLVKVPARVTARIKFPPTVLFDLLRALNTQLGKYEEKFGPIARPGEETPTFPPEGFQPDDPGDSDV